MKTIIDISELKKELTEIYRAVDLCIPEREDTDTFSKTIALLDQLVSAMEIIKIADKHVKICPIGPYPHQSQSYCNLKEAMIKHDKDWGNVG